MQVSKQTLCHFLWHWFDSPVLDWFELLLILNQGTVRCLSSAIFFLTIKLGKEGSQTQAQMLPLCAADPPPQLCANLAIPSGEKSTQMTIAAKKTKFLFSQQQNFFVLKSHFFLEAEKQRFLQTHHFQIWQKIRAMFNVNFSATGFPTQTQTGLEPLKCFCENAETVLI